MVTQRTAVRIWYNEMTLALLPVTAIIGIHATGIATKTSVTVCLVAEIALIGTTAWAEMTHAIGTPLTHIVIHIITMIVLAALTACREVTSTADLIGTPATTGIRGIMTLIGTATQTTMIATTAITGMIVMTSRIDIHR